MSEEQVDQLEQPIEDTRPYDTVTGHVAKHDFMLSNTVQIGKVVKPKKGKNGDPTKPKTGAFVLVQVGGVDDKTYTRNWMPWLTRRAGCDSEWWKPDVDEQVLVLAPSGNLALGVVAGCIYRGERVHFPKETDFTQPPSESERLPANEHVHRQIYRDGTTMEYDPTQQTMTYHMKRKVEEEHPSISLRAALTDDKGIEITVDKTTIQVTDKSVKITDPNGSILEMKDGAIKLESSKIVLKGGSTTVTVDNNGADVT